MERRLAVTYIISATTTLGIACVAIAAVGGGLFASAAPQVAGGKQVELIDDYIVVHSETTAETIAGAADLGAAAAAAVTATAASAGPTAPADTPAPGAIATAPPQTSAGAAPDAPRSESPASTTPPAPATTAGAPTPAATAAPSPTAAPAPTAAPTTQPRAPAPTAAPTTQPPAPTVTTAAPAIAGVPQGARIPSDWPASKPIPPIPPGCKMPQLEDNGVWNCQ